MPYISFLQCEICSQLPSSQGADILKNEGFSSQTWKLKGMPDSPPSSSCREYVQCPICTMDYLFQCETGCMEYDIYISRVRPLELLQKKIISKQRYDQLIQHFPNDLNHKDDDAVSFLAASLAEHYLEHQLSEQMIALLTHKNSKIRLQTCYAICRFEGNGGDIAPYINFLMEFLFDPDGGVRDAATYIYNVYGKETKNIRKYANRLVEMFSTRDMSYHTIRVLDKIVSSNLLKKVDLTPCLPKMILMFQQTVKYDYFYDDLKKVLLSYVKYSKSNAEAFLAEYGNTSEENYIFSLKALEESAQQRCDQKITKITTSPKASLLYNSYTKSQIIELLISVEDCDHQNWWKKSRLIAQLSSHSPETVLSTFTSDELRKALRVLGLKTSGIKKERFTRLLEALTSS